MKYKDFTDFPVWKKGFELLLLTYKSTKEFPAEEKFGMISDMRRAANSIVHNIAEGYGRYESKDKSRFYKISRGSAYELLSQSLASKALGFLPGYQSEKMNEKCKEIIGELDALIKAVEQGVKKTSAFS